MTFVPAGEAVAFRCHPLGVMRRQAAGLGLRHELVSIERAEWEASYRRGARRARGGGRRARRDGRHHAAGVAVAGGGDAAPGLALETPLATADDEDAGALLDFLADAGVEATVDGRARRALPRRLPRPARSGARCWPRTASTTRPPSIPAASEASTTRSSRRFAARASSNEDPAALAHVERDGIWALDWPLTYTSDFH